MRIIRLRQAKQWYEEEKESKKGFSWNVRIACTNVYLIQGRLLRTTFDVRIHFRLRLRISSNTFTWYVQLLFFYSSKDGICQKTAELAIKAMFSDFYGLSWQLERKGHQHDCWRRAHVTVIRTLYTIVTSSKGSDLLLQLLPLTFRNLGALFNNSGLFRKTVWFLLRIISLFLWSYLKIEWS